MRKALLFLCLLVVSTAAAAHADCRYRAGDRIVLYGAMDDPDVFLWDSRFRMRDYQGGTWDQAQALLPHARLAPPGSRAVVAECVPNFVQSKYRDDPDDAMGVVITSGPLRGERGWVISSDIRGLYRDLRR